MPLLAAYTTPAELHQINEAYNAHVKLVVSTPSRYSSANNHRLVELTGLLSAALVGSTELSWDRLWEELEVELLRQTFVDGGSREQGSGYFLYVLETMWVAGLLARAADRRLGRIAGRLESMLDWLAAISDAAGEPPTFGDDAEDRMLRLDYFEPRRASVIAGRVRALLDGEPTLSPRQIETDAESRMLLESGYCVFRSGGVRIVFDVGELGFGSLAAHGHADALSVVVDVEGRTVLRDSGTGAYAPPEVREPFKSTLAHNTVAVDGQSQAVSRGSHLWGRRFRVSLEAAALDRGYDYVRASHDGYRHTRAGALHTRSVLFLKPNVLVVLDRVRAKHPCEATLVWQRMSDARENLGVASAPRATFNAGVGPYSPRYTWIEEAPRSTWTATGDDVVFASVIGLDAAPAVISSLDHESGVTRIRLSGPLRTMISEDWQSPRPRIED